MKRFIAGAVCPECRALDRLVLEVRVSPEGTEEEWQRCVACGYEARRPQVTSGPSSVPRGKPERRGQDVREVTPQTLKIMDLQTKLDPQDEPK